MLKKHQKIERNSILMLILVIVVISIGAIIEIIPLFRMETTIEKVKGMRPYTPLELTGQNIYIREGCYLCHSQQIRSLRGDVERYGHYSLAAESMYDYPFQWGSKRTGPDIARIGGKYSDQWQVQHLINPRSVVPGSIMPNYSSLAKNKISFDNIANDMSVLKIIGVPYTDQMIKNAVKDANSQVTGENKDELINRYGNKVNIRNFDGKKAITEMDALVSYLQVLGTMVDFKDYDSGLNIKK